MEIYYDGIPLHPIGPVIIQTTDRERQALRYVWQRILADRDYVCLSQMARHTGLTYDQCENFIAKFHAERTIPRIQIVEELEG